MKKLITAYSFNKTAKTVTFTGLTTVELERILLIVNVTRNVIIYQFNDPALSGAVAGNVLTLAFDTTAQANGDKLQIFYDSADGETITVNPQEGTAAAPVRLAPNPSWRTSFSSAVSNGVSSLLTLLQTGSGQTVNQTGGNLLLTTGTTANAETVIRSKQGWYNNSLVLRWAAIASQRIINSSLIVELVDLVGDGLAYTINSATSVTVTIPNNPFDASCVGQAVNLGVITGAAGIPGRYVIAAVSGNDVTFTVAAWPATGTGTLSLTGWNYYQVVYTGATATQATFDAQRRGYNSGATTATISTTAGVGHVGQIYSEDTYAALTDALAASNAGFAWTQRASRLVNLPAGDAQLFVQVRVLNGSTAPLSTTTFTLGFISLEEFIDTPVSIRSGKPVGGGAAVQAQIMNAPSVDTEITTAAASADALANPTVGQVGAIPSLFNGTTWDRFRGNINTTTGDTGAKTTTFAGATQTNYNHAGAIITLVVGAVTGTTPSMTPQLQYSDDGGTTWTNYGPAMPAITATGTHILVVYPANTSQAAGVTPANLTTGGASTTVNNAPMPRTWRLNYTISGTTPSLTITRVGVNYIL